MGVNAPEVSNPDQQGMHSLIPGRLLPMFTSADSCFVRLVSASSTRISQQLAGLRALRIAGVGALGAAQRAGVSLSAQTAHYNGSVNRLGSGFSDPTGVAVDASGDVFVADQVNSAIYEIVAVNGQVSLSSAVIPVGSGFSGPRGVAVDLSGDVFVADRGNNAVYEIMAGTGGAAGGQVSLSSAVIPVGSGFSDPWGVAVDASGDVFVADNGNRSVKEIVAGTGGAASGQVSSNSTVNFVGSGFVDPVGVTVDASGDVFVADNNENAVYEIVAGTGGAASGQVSLGSAVIPVGSGFSKPSGVAVDSSGDVFVADNDNNAVKEIVAIGGQVTSSSTVKTVGGGFSFPSGVAVDGGGDVFVADSGHSAVKEVVAGDNFGALKVGNASSTPSRFISPLIPAAR